MQHICNEVWLVKKYQVFIHLLFKLQSIYIYIYTHFNILLWFVCFLRKSIYLFNYFYKNIIDFFDKEYAKNIVKKWAISIPPLVLSTYLAMLYIFLIKK